MELEVAARKANEPEMEYQIAHALRSRNDVRATPSANPFISYGHDKANSAAKAGVEYFRYESA